MPFRLCGAIGFWPCIGPTSSSSSSVAVVSGHIWFFVGVDVGLLNCLKKDAFLVIRLPFLSTVIIDPFTAITVNGSGSNGGMVLLFVGCRMRTQSPIDRSLALALLL